ncbi:MAG: TonB family protein [Deltaproteobacteria bacterium]|nr:TonB family protein [Deltaproteobacteria bacterium]
MMNFRSLTFVGSAIGVLAIAALWIALDVNPVTPGFLKEKPFLKAASKKKKPIEIEEVHKPAPKVQEQLAAPRSIANLSQLRPQVSSALKGFGEGSGGFGGDFDEAGGQGGTASAAVDKAGIERLAKVIKRVEPRFPQGAREKNVSGFVVVEVQVSTAGQPVRVRVVESQPSGVFDASAIEAMQSWVFEPAMVRGQPVASQVVQRVRFDLE